MYFAISALQNSLLFKINYSKGTFLILKKKKKDQGVGVMLGKIEGRRRG